MYHRASALCLSIMSILVVSVDQANASEHYTNTIGMKMVHIQRGHFMMGQDEGGDWDEQPVHKVTITQPFYMSETEVTVEQFRQFRPNFTGIEEHGPYVAGISWYDAMAFCAWLSKKEGKPYRLPTEAEWEYACRADHQTLLSRQKV